MSFINQQRSSGLPHQELRWCISCEWEVKKSKIRMSVSNCRINHFSLSLQIALLLLENGADPNATDKLESTPLHRACAKGNYRLIQLLLKQSASTNIQDSQGNTPL